MKQILLYSPIWSFTAETFIEKFSGLDSNEDVTIRINSPGGSVFAGWGMTRSIMDHKGKVIVKVDGIAASMAFYLALYADEVEALDVSRFLIHRADGYVENDDQKAELKKVNDLIRGKMERRIKADVFQQVTGISYDELFASDKLKDVWIGAKEAKKMGLVDRIMRLDPKEIAAMEKNFYAFADESQGSDSARGSEEQKQKENNNNNLITKKMTKAEFKAQNPEIYAEIYAEGLEAGKKAELVRAQTWMAYLDIDKENVIASIKEGKEFTTAVMAEMAVKMQSAATIVKIAADGADPVTTDKPVEKTAEQIAIDAEIAQVKIDAKKITLY